MNDSKRTDLPLDLHDPTNRQAIETALPDYVRTRRWFGGKARPIRETRIADSLTIGHGESRSTHMAIVDIVYADGDSQHYVVPLKIDLVPEPDHESFNPAGEIARWAVQSGIARRTLIASDATFDVDFASGLLDAVVNARRWTGGHGDIVAWSATALTQLVPPNASLEPSVMGAEQSNTSIRFGDALILKLFRRLEEGTSPELEIGRALQAAKFRETPPLGGALEYHRPGMEPLTLGVLQGYVANRGDAWGYTLESLAEYFERALGDNVIASALDTPPTDLLEAVNRAVPGAFAGLAGGYSESAAMLGRTTGRMHIALAREGSGRAFDPEPLELEHLEHMFGAMRLLADQAFGLLEANRQSLPPEASEEADTVLRRSHDVEGHFASMLRGDIGGMRTRVHGDYHLGQVLYTGSEFFIIDFEGEPARSLAERRRKHSPLKDVAGMVRSFHYAAYSGLFNYGRKHGTAVARAPELERAAEAWYTWSSAAFLREYVDTVTGSGLLPADKDGIRALLSAYLLEKAVYELVYELNNRPTWVAIPLKGIAALLA